jgi:hypothetical protein
VNPPVLAALAEGGPLPLHIGVWERPRVVDWRGHRLQMHDDGHGLALLSSAPEDADEIACTENTRAILDAALDGETAFHGVDRTHLAVDLLGHMVAMNRVSFVCAVSGLWMRSDTLALVLAADVEQVGATPHPVPARTGLPYRALLWLGSGWAILQAGSREPQRSGPSAQASIPALTIQAGEP